MKRTIRLNEFELKRIISESVNKILTESTQFDRKLPEVIEFLEALSERLDSGLISVEGFVGGNRMFAIQSINSCISYLKKMSGNLNVV